MSAGGHLEPRSGDGRLPLDERQAGWRFGALQPRLYSVILADPPWRWQAQSDKGLKRSPQRHYDCMALPEIQELPVGQLADPAGCLLWLWATAPMLQQALATMSAWGFLYVTSGVWHKRTQTGGTAWGLGYTLRNAHELFLLGTRGTVSYGPERTRVLSVIEAPRRQHSRKPDEQYLMLDRLVPAGPRCELFARTNRAGWEAWGNEVADSVSEVA